MLFCERRISMKKILKIFTVFVLLFGIYFANEFVISKPLEAQTAYTDDKVELPIIMYHSILRDTARAGDYVVSPDALASDLDYLKSNGYETVTISDLIRYVDGLADLPEKPVMITFDDGHFNNYLYAYPLLKERNMTAVISVIGSETEKFTNTGEENAYWSYLNINRLKEMSDVFEIQNHSYDMHSQSPRKGSTRIRGESKEDYQNILVSDTEKLQKLLTDNGISAPTCYTYPYGIYSSESEEIIESLGFLCTLTCEERVNTLTRNPECLFKLGRFNRPSGISTEEFFKKIS